MKVIESEDIILRILGEEDVDHLMKFQNDIQLKKSILAWPFPVSRLKVQSWLETLSRSNDEVVLGIVHKGANDLIGIVRLMNVNLWHRKAELGIYIGDPNYRHKGLGKQTMRLVVEWAFHFLGLHRIFLRVLSENADAIAAFKSVGFQVEGIMREDVCQEGTYKDVTMMGLLGKEYTKTAL